MIPEIGVMIGAYIVTRMAEIMAAGSQRPLERSLVRIFAGVTLVLTLYVIASLWTRGTSAGF